MKQQLRIKICLFLNYFVFAFLLNSVGAVILQVQRNFSVSKSDASLLEGFKDLPIAIASFLLASLLPKLGLKKSMLIALALVGLGCLVMPFANEFWYFKILFLVIGVSFALIKVTVFATIGLITNNQKEHSSLMSSIEGFFMVGVLLGNVIFSLFVDDSNPASTAWLNVYWLLAGLSFVAFFILFITPLDEKEAVIEERSLGDDFLAMLKMIALPLIMVFICSVFLFVLIEQSFQTWTPTFYKDILSLPASMAIQAGAILAGAFAIGRLMAGYILKKVSWLPVVLTCISGAAIMVLISLPLAKNIVVDGSVNWFSAPLVAYVFPLMGLFLAPIYPIINSITLSALPKHMHASMSGLIVVFSALGGTAGSMITGNVFEHFSGQTAFYLSLIPMVLLALSVILFKNLQKKTRFE